MLVNLTHQLIPFKNTRLGPSGIYPILKRDYEIIGTLNKTINVECETISGFYMKKLPKGTTDVIVSDVDINDIFSLWHTCDKKTKDKLYNTFKDVNVYVTGGVIFKTLEGIEDCFIGSNPDDYYVVSLVKVDMSPLT